MISIMDRLKGKVSRVKVTELKIEKDVMISAITKAAFVSVFDERTFLRFKELFFKINSEYTKVFKIKWEGIREPRGLEISGHVIKRACDGHIFDTNGHWIGLYMRTTDCGGEKGRDQEIMACII